MPGMPNSSTLRQSICLRAANGIMPTRLIPPTMASDPAIATLSGWPSTYTRIGTVRMEPPEPSRPRLAPTARAPSMATVTGSASLQRPVLAGPADGAAEQVRDFREAELCQVRRSVAGAVAAGADQHDRPAVRFQACGKVGQGNVFRARDVSGSVLKCFADVDEAGVALPQGSDLFRKYFLVHCFLLSRAEQPAQDPPETL